MITPSFQDFFGAANEGRQPFPWQVRLASAFIDPAEPWPDWLTVPTGLGKTAVIDAWVYALAKAQLSDGVNRHVPTRLIFVVNRRGIVDDSFARAQRLCSALQSALDSNDSGPLGWAARALLSVGFALENPLQAVRMRGGVSWDWRWLRQPDQPYDP